MRKCLNSRFNKSYCKSWTVWSVFAKTVVVKVRCCWYAVPGIQRSRVQKLSTSNSVREQRSQTVLTNPNSVWFLRWSTPRYSYRIGVPMYANACEQVHWPTWPLWPVSTSVGLQRSQFMLSLWLGGRDWGLGITGAIEVSVPTSFLRGATRELLSIIREVFVCRWGDTERRSVDNACVEKWYVDE